MSDRAINPSESAGIGEAGTRLPIGCEELSRNGSRVTGMIPPLHCAPLRANNGASTRDFTCFLTLFFHRSITGRSSQASSSLLLCCCASTSSSLRISQAKLPRTPTSAGVSGLHLRGLECVLRARLAQRSRSRHLLALNSRSILRSLKGLATKPLVLLRHRAHFFSSSSRDISLRFH